MGPSSPVDTENETPMPHRTRINFALQEIGEYALKFSWNRIPLPHSPVLAVATVTAADSDALHLSSGKSRASSISSNGSAGDQKVVLTGNGLAKATKGVEAEFTIDGSRAGPGNNTLLHLSDLKKPKFWQFFYLNNQKKTKFWSFFYLENQNVDMKA